MLTLLILINGFIFSIHTYAKQIYDVRVANNDKGKTRVVFDVDKGIHFHYFSLSNPYRFVVDFENSTNQKDLTGMSLSNTVLKKVRTGQPKKGTLRIVFELNHSAKVTHLVLAGEKKDKQRIVFDFEEKNKRQLEKNNKQQIPMISKGRDIIVVIDAGHGGKDPGAIGQKGTKEKQIVLAIAKKLQALVNKEEGMKAVMTRDNNYYVTLRQRLSKAHTSKGDVFISIHADAFKNTKSSGASVYALSLKGASSEAARWLAEKENYSELGRVDLSDKDDVLRSVLIDLSRTATISASLNLGNLVLKNLGTISKLHHSNVEQARFVVLKSLDIPSILVETGFISNLQEEQKLQSAQYQQKLAQAIINGIKSYFRYHAPPETHIAMRYQGKNIAQVS